MTRDIFQAIADPTRRAILVLLASGALTPGAIAADFEVSRQAVSKHLKVLRECDLVETTRMGRELEYHLLPDKMQEADEYLEQFRHLWEQRFTELDSLLSELQNKNNEPDSQD